MNALRTRLAVACLFTLLSASPAFADDRRYVDLELVLAVDGSRSMDAHERNLQLQGYVKAIQSSEVVRAIQLGALGRIAVTYFEWAQPDVRKVIMPWSVIEDMASAQDFAAGLSEAPSMSGGHGTSISSALLFAADSFEQNGFEGTRRVIDVSGDGPNNNGRSVEEARDDVLRRGIIINGLPIVIRPSLNTKLDVYYEDCVIGGPGSFIVSVTKMEEFEAAVRRKLVLEIADRGGGPDTVPVILASAGGADMQSETDCLVGEKSRRSGGNYQYRYNP